jgi:hypothetical protein
MRGVCLRCIAALSMHSELRDQILAQGAMPLLCRLAKLRGLVLQVPVAAALANMCSTAGLLSGAEDVADCFAALNTLSQSSNGAVPFWALWHLSPPPPPPLLWNTLIASHLCSARWKFLRKVPSPPDWILRSGIAAQRQHADRREDWAGWRGNYRLSQIVAELGGEGTPD